MGSRLFKSPKFELEAFTCVLFQEDLNRGKPNWEHLNDDLHVLITVEDSENRANMKLQRAVEEVKKLLVVVGAFELKGKRMCLYFNFRFIRCSPKGRTSSRSDS